jgi:hypothetical protein
VHSAAARAANSFLNLAADSAMMLRRSGDRLAELLHAASSERTGLRRRQAVGVVCHSRFDGRNDSGRLSPHHGQNRMQDHRRAAVVDD